jgi:hypothetical protein
MARNLLILIAIFALLFAWAAVLCRAMLRGPR